jgi:hypothetical protein
VLGRSYAELAAEGRSKHRSQDFGMIQPRGSQVRTFPRIESAVEAPDRETSLFAGLDTSITGIAKFAGPGGDKLTPALTKIKEAAARAASEFKAEDPAGVVPHLVAGLREVRALRPSLAGLDPVARADVGGLLARKEQEFVDALAKANGVIVDALSNTEIATPGEWVDVSVNVYSARSAEGARS